MVENAMRSPRLRRAPENNHDACVVVPMFNEATVVADVVRELRTAFDVVICVDDGSTDGSALVAAAAGAIVVPHATNLGSGAALQTGLEYALRFESAEYIVTFDADGQHRVDDAVDMVARARETGLQVILGSRFLTSETNVPRGRRALLRAALVMTRFSTRLALTDTHNGLRVLRRSAALEMRLLQCGMAHASELEKSIAKFGWTYAEHPVSVLYTDYSRGKGQRGINAVNILFDLMTAQLRTVR